MTTAPVRAAPARLAAVRTVPSRPPRMAAGDRPTARQLADTARRVADTYPELLTPAEFDPTTFSHDQDDELVAVRRLPVRSQRRVGRDSVLRLPAVLGRSVTMVAHSAAALVTLSGRVVGLVTLAEQTLTAIHAAVTRTDALLDRVESVTRTAEGVVQAASREVTAAARAVEQARDLTARAAPLLEGYSEPLLGLEPMTRRLGVTTLPHEVDALESLLDRLPQLADAMDHGVIPLLGHLDQVGPDVNQLLDRVSQLNHMASRLPKVFRRVIAS
ncbi:MAG: hypothetical protein ACRDUV_05090 [Pseudonocardiaceae bacterium]